MYENHVFRLCKSTIFSSANQNNASYNGLLKLTEEE